MAKKTDNTEIQVYDPSAMPGISMIQDNPQAMENAIKHGRMAPKVFNLAEGQQITCKVIGEGPSLESTTADGEEKAIPTFLIELENGVRLALMASHQLLQQLPPLFGHKVYIARGAQKNVGSRRVNEFVVSDLEPVLVS